MSIKPTKIKPLINSKFLTEESLEGVWKVVLFNCYCHTDEEVSEKLMEIFSLGYAASYRIIDEVERSGSATVFQGSFSESTRIANLLGNTGLDVRMVN